MTATDELRRLLEERGVEHKDNDVMTFSETCWGSTYAFQLSPDAALMMRVTPEQAVEATLGRGECSNTQGDFDFMCSECGMCVDDGGWLGFSYCPRCGRRVVK